jgi:hypothetical protein
MDKQDYIEILKGRLENETERFSKLTGSQFARPQTVVDIWRFVLDIKTLCALTGGDYAKMIDTYTGLSGMDRGDVAAYATYGEWIALDRSTRNLTPEEYEEFWGEAENQPNIFVPPTADEDDACIALLNEMWNL